jgi:hypothetical protein
LEDNRALRAALLRAGVDVITDLNPKIFHQKFVVRDPGTDSAAVLTGSAKLHPHRHRDEHARQLRAAGQQPQPCRRVARQTDRRAV